MLLDVKCICHLLSAFCLADQWLRHIMEPNQWQKKDVLSKTAFWLSDYYLFWIQWSEAMRRPIDSNADLSKLMWTQRSMHSSHDVSAQSDRAPRSLPLIHHRPHIILLLMALALGQSICFSHLWQEAECWMRFILQPRQQRCTQLSPMHLLIITPPNNLPRDTFDNIMWSRSEDSGNETEWWMLLSAALTLLIVTHSWNPTKPDGNAVKIKSIQGK